MLFMNIVIQFADNFNREVKKILFKTFNYDARGNQTLGDGYKQVWDNRNRMTESWTAANALLGSFTYNERGLRVKAVRAPQPVVQVVEPNGGESLFLGGTSTISWNGQGLAGAQVKLELLADGAVAGTIAENLPGLQTSYEWPVGQTLGGMASPGSHYRVRVTAVVPLAGPSTT